MKHWFTLRLHVIAPCSLLIALCTGCSVNTLVANALTGEGSSTVFTGDTDLQLVGDALPFAVKMYEALLDSTPKHRGLQLTTGSLFVMYANAFVHEPAQMLPFQEWQAREAGLRRAKRLCLRGQEILINGLDQKHKGFRQALTNENAFKGILKKCGKDDVGFLYWATLGGMAAFSVDVFDFELATLIPRWSLMIQRAYELDPDFGVASIDEFLITFYASLPGMMGGDIERAKYHFQLALEKTGSQSAGAYVNYAQSVCVSAEDYDSFKDCLEKALAIDPDANISTRLVTIMSQRKAEWLLENAYEFFSFLPLPDGY
jgi:predicted anti-sigma-YlaC factor YlaD